MHAEPSSSSSAGGSGRHWLDLPRDLLADIHGRLRFTDRLTFTAVFGDLFFPKAPWLVIPEDTSLTYYKTTFFSLADRRATTVRSLPLRNSDVLLGSSGGWLAMADKEGRMHLINPVTGKQHTLPAITTMVGFNLSSFSDPGHGFCRPSPGDEKELTSEVVATGLAVKGGKRLVTTPDGRLMVVSWDVVHGYAYISSSKDSFKMHVLDEASGNWLETNDIGQAAVLIGAANNVMCVSTRDHQKLTGNCVYFTNALKREVGVYSLRHRTLTNIEEFKVAARWTNMWKATAWFTPSFP
ncbi:unnamed protein product [Alopecurus aequalis]